jgi:hypothetical protein
MYACAQQTIKTAIRLKLTKQTVSHNPYLGAGVAAAVAGAAGADCAVAGACAPCLYQGVSPRFSCIHDSFFQSNVCQSGPTMPPISLLFPLYTHLQCTHDSVMLQLLVDRCCSQSAHGPHPCLQNLWKHGMSIACKTVLV